MNTSKKLLILSTVFILSTTGAFAQSSLKGKDFWMAFGQNSAYNLTSDVNLLLKVASEKNTTVTLNFTNGTPSRVINVTAGTVAAITLSNTEKAAVYNLMPSGGGTATTNLSLRITAPDSITVYAANMRMGTSDATAVLPVSLLGKNYYHAGYRPVIPVTVGGAGARDGYLVVATQSGTNIYRNGSPVATLNAGQVYAWYGRAGEDNQGLTYADVKNNMDLTGTHITADKPVAYFTVNSSASIPATYRYADVLYEQLFPVENWGTEFFVPSTIQSKMRIRIIAAFDGTNITIPGIQPASTNGSTLKANTGIMGPIVTEPANPTPPIAQVISGPRSTGGEASLTNLQTGQYVEIDVGSAANGCYIKSTCPVMVIAYMVSSGNSMYQSHSYNATPLQGDPSLAYVPPVGQYARNVSVARFSAVFLSQTSINNHYVQIITKTDGKYNTTVRNGGTTVTLSSPGIWYDNSGLSYCSYNLSNDNTYIIDNPNGVVVGGYGYGEVETYHYLAGAAARNLIPSLKVNGEYYDLMDGTVYECEPVTIECTSECDLPTSIIWRLNGVVQNAYANELSWSLTPSDGNYILEMEAVVNGITHILTTRFTIQNCIRNYRWWYISSPYSNSNPSAFDIPAGTLGKPSGSMLGYYYEQSKNYTDPPFAIGAANFIPGRGIAASLDTLIAAFNPPTAATFAAGAALTPNTGNILINVYRTGNLPKTGINLLGNPYLQHIDFNLFHAANSAVIENTMYIRGWNLSITPLTPKGRMIYDTYNAASGIGTKNINNIDITRDIPPIQGFWVMAKQVGEKTVTFMDAHKMTGSQILRAPAANAGRIVRITVRDSIGIADEMIIIFNPAASNGYDLFDSEKMSNGDDSIPELYTFVDNRELVINGMKPLPYRASKADEIPLGFRTGKKGGFTISASFENWDNKDALVLRDYDEMRETVLTTEGKLYGFTANSCNTMTRFSLFLEPATGITDITKNNTQIYINEENRIVVQTNIHNAQCTVYNTIGQKLTEETILSNPQILDCILYPGVYLVKVGDKTEKVIIR